MTKQEMYDALKADGAKLGRGVNFISKETLEEMYQERLGMKKAETAKEPEKKQDPGTPPVLYFDHAGWCETLGCSYFIGYFFPQSWAEYNALKPYAKGGAE